MEKKKELNKVAISADDLEFSVDIDTDDAIDGIEQLDASTMELGESMEAVQKAAFLLDQAIRDLKKSERQLEKANRAVVRSSHLLIAGFEAQVILVDRLVSSFNLLSSHVNFLIKWFEHLEAMFGVLADDELLDYIEKLGRRLRLIAYFKGFDLLYHGVVLVVKGFQKVNEAAKQALAGMAAFRKYTENIVNTARLILGLDKEVSSLNSALEKKNKLVEGLANTYSELNAQLEIAKKGVNLFTNALEVLTDDEKMNNIHANLFAMQMLAKSKGWILLLRY